MWSDEARSRFPILGLQSVKNCARILNLDVAQLDLLATKSQTYYRPFDVPKKSGGVRKIDRPIGLLKDVQERINRVLLARCAVSSIAFGSVKGRSYIAGAARHTRKPGSSRKRAVGALDIKDYFPSVTHRHVYQLFCAMHCSVPVSRLLTQLLTYDGHLPQGSPASSTLANLVPCAADHDILRAANTRQVAVSRIVDDVHLSGGEDDVKSVLNVAVVRLNHLGLKLNRQKTHVRPSSCRQIVAGIGVNTKASVPKPYRKAVRDAVRRAVRYGISDDERQKLRGRINHIGQLHPTRALELNRLLNAAPTQNLSQGSRRD